MWTSKIYWATYWIAIHPMDTAIKAWNNWARKSIFSYLKVHQCFFPKKKYNLATFQNILHLFLFNRMLTFITFKTWEKPIITCFMRCRRGLTLLLIWCHKKYFASMFAKIWCHTNTFVTSNRELTHPPSNSLINKN